MNGTRHGQQPSTTSISDSLTLHDLSGEDTVDDHDEGDYSARLEELLKDDEGEHKTTDGAEDEDEEEGFFYTGVDSQPSGTYREQLRDVLGPENEDDEQEEKEVENSLVRSVQDNEIYEAAMDDEARVRIPRVRLTMRYAHTHIARKLIL